MSPEPSLRALQEAFTRLCFDASPAEADLELLHGDPARWRVYRRMVRSRLMGMVRNALPGTVELLGRGAVDAATAAYLAERGPTTRFIREVVGELLEHALPRWEAMENAPPHLGDLVRLEHTRWQVASLDATPPPVREFDFEGVPVISPWLRHLPVSFRVDRDAVAPVALDAPHRILVYRRADDPKVRAWVLNPIGAQLFDAWCEPQPCSQAVRSVMTALDRGPDPRFLDGMAEVLAGLLEREMILGSRPCGERHLSRGRWR